MPWEDGRSTPQPLEVAVVGGSRDIQLHAMVVVPVDTDEMDTSGCRAQRSTGRAWPWAEEVGETTWCAPAPQHRPDPDRRCC